MTFPLQILFKKYFLERDITQILPGLFDCYIKTGLTLLHFRAPVYIYLAKHLKKIIDISEKSDSDPASIQALCDLNMAICGHHAGVMAALSLVLRSIIKASDNRSVDL